MQCVHWRHLAQPNQDQGTPRGSNVVVKESKRYSDHPYTREKGCQWNKNINIVGREQAGGVAKEGRKLQSKRDDITFEEPPAPFRTEVRSAVWGNQDMVVPVLVIAHDLIRVLIDLQEKLVKMVEG